MDAADEVVFDGAILCESAEPAADFADLLELLLCKTLDAAVAASLDVNPDLVAIFDTSFVYFFPVK